MTVRQFLNSFKVYTTCLEFKCGVKRIRVSWRSGIDKCPDEFLDKEISVVSHTGNSIVFWVKEL